MSRSVGSLLYSATRVVTFFSLTPRAPPPPPPPPPPRGGGGGGGSFLGEAAVCLLKGTRDNAQR